MTREFKLEDPGEGIHEAEITEIHVSEGDTVKDGDTLLSVETDKAVTDVPAPFNGKIGTIEVKEGDRATVGDVLMTYTEEGSSSDEDETADQDRERDKDEVESKGEDRKRDKGRKKEDGADRESEAEEGKERGSKKEKPHAEHDEPEEEPDARAGDKGRSDQKEEKSEGPVPAAPAVRWLAREMDVDLRAVEPSGPQGRVTADDVQAVAEERKEGAKEKREERPAREATIDVPPLPDFRQWGPVEEQPFRSVRRATAKKMAISWAQIPHVMHKDVADITDLERFRRQHTSEVEAEGGKLTLTILMMKAVVAALKQYPYFNASLDLDNQEIIVKRYYNIGVAVATDQGLLVPVIRNVDRKSIVELSVELTEAAERARQGRASREDMQGGSFTITNPGGLGGVSFTPIINHPEAAILGMGAAGLEPVIQGDIDDYQVVARLRLPLCLVYDHRLNDGAVAARFLRTIIDLLRDPESFLLTV